MKREAWFELARDLDWEFSYVRPEEVFPPEVSGSPWLDQEEWQGWDEPYKTTYAGYVANQSEKERALVAVRSALGRISDFKRLPRTWLSGLKFHYAMLPLAEFAAVIGNLRAARFGRTAAWRTAASFGALDELRHTQIPLLLMHPLVAWDEQFDWTHRLFHTDNWVAIAARHLTDELLLAADPIELAVGANFVFETGFTNLQFIGLSAVAHDVGDRLFETLLGSIQSDEARHAQIGGPVLAKVVEKDPKRAQRLVDKWFWRSWQLFALVTGFAMDYLTPLAERRASFKEFMQEWVVDQFLETLREHGLERPWYWETFVGSLDHYHHMVYASAYSYRASVWFDLVVPGPEERAWLRDKYPASWPSLEPVWEQITARWRQADPGNEFAVHGAAIVGFCELCQLVLCGGKPDCNGAVIAEHGGRRRIFCSEPCRWIFESEPERYAGHAGLVQRVLEGKAPANLLALLRQTFGLTHDSWGKDAFGGTYPWLTREPR